SLIRLWSYPTNSAVSNTMRRCWWWIPRVAWCAYSITPKPIRRWPTHARSHGELARDERTPFKPPRAESGGSCTAGDPGVDAGARCPGIVHEPAHAAAVSGADARRRAAVRRSADAYAPSACTMERVGHQRPCRGCLEPRSEEHTSE